MCTCIHIYMHVYIQIDCLSEIFPPGLTVLLPRAMDYLKTNKWTNKHLKKKKKRKKTPLLCMRSPL